MKILILNWRDTKNPLSGGAEIVTLEHAKAWVKAGNTVTWFASHFSGAKNEEYIDGVKLIRRGGPLSVYLFAPFFYLFSGKTFDIVIDEIHGIPFFTPLYVKKPKIAFIHEIAGEIWDYMYPFPFNTIGKILESCYLSLYKNIHFWTDAQSTITELISKGIIGKNCVAIPCPISNAIVATVPIKEKNLTCIFVSRLVKMKGVERVLEAFSFILEKDPKAMLWVVGGGDLAYLKYLQTKVKHLGTSVHFFGKVSDNEKLALMGKAHILLHASVKEGWGLVVLEAASQGTPSVVYNVAGLKDSVKDQQTGIVLKENSPYEMAKQTLQLYEDKKLYKKYQENGLAWVKSLTWKQVTKESEKLLYTI